ncbi:MAG: tyrosine--tRNA ligase [Candidatus Wildermuthbacteria bacterium]|nr:tyrosine--tRNA ligase [Candidatus Wildermuthbacteria bacterium]
MKYAPTQEDLLSRQVEAILPTRQGLEEFLKNKKARVYLGIDPTGTRLHLGHAITLRKLQQFADLGNEAILVLGTGTVLAGDPSQRDSARPRITEKEIRENIKTWKKQAARIIDFSKVKLVENGKWLKALGLSDILNIASHVSAVQLFQRDMFQKRIQKGDTVWTHELLYPLLQGYDSVALDVDLEIGGTDQTFNMLVGRELQRKMKNREKFVLTVPMIMGTDGRQMSKTKGNCVWLADAPQEMFGKIMSMPDENIVSYLTLVTTMPLPRVEEIKKALELKTMNPKAAKEILAKEVVKDFHGEAAAESAAAEFKSIFEEKQQPKEIPEVSASRTELPLIDLIVEIGIAPSKTQARALIEQRGVKIDGVIQEDPGKLISVKKEIIIQAGPRRFMSVKSA